MTSGQWLMICAVASSTRMQLCARHESFTEMLFVDATHKLTNLRMPLYVFLVSDGNGQSEIVGTCLVSSERGRQDAGCVQVTRT